MPIEFRFTRPCVNDIKQLRKRFRLIDRDIDALRNDFRRVANRGVPISGYGIELYKARLSNRSAHRGKSGGFRAIYHPDREGRFIFIHIYSKTDQNDASASEIQGRIKDIE
ncbi:MAG: type II toxin-antitoxin system RelE/ParE family toxin [Chloroflexota bacterium]|nr:type II toxin-antitoxin system RelE/ParE family toxin [Chloroflexota bacterium]